MVLMLVAAGIVLCAAAVLFHGPRLRSFVRNARSAPRFVFSGPRSRRSYSHIFESLVCESGPQWTIARIAVALLPVMVAVLTMMALMRLTPL
jgi:hypothetical protein